MKIKHTTMAGERLIDGAWYYQFNFKIVCDRPSRYDVEEWSDILDDITELVVPSFCPEETFHARFIDIPRIFACGLQLSTTARLSNNVVGQIIARLDNTTVNTF